MKSRFFILLLFILICGCKEADKDPELNSKKTSLENSVTNTVFEKVNAPKSGINFANTITHNLVTNENLFDFDYFYNGSGVGVEDLNNDGLLDIFFCGNQVANKLYFNTGDLSFEDVTVSSQIGTIKSWSNGVTFVDINNDGWKDIYVSQGGPGTRETRKNLLYINQEGLSFKEEAEAYGLADTGISTQAAFFDYDKDGDLDCIVMNENELHGVDPINLYKIVKEHPELQYFNSSHLYRNDNGAYVDVTKEAGIQQPLFGLGLCVSDINNDGWLDIYMASDYYIPDVLFVNNKNGTFSDKIKNATNQVSFYGMGVDISDINNDNLQDIFVLDMASSDHIRSKTLMASMSTNRFDFLVNKSDFHYQYMYNSLQLNIGEDKFNNIAQLSEIANTDWSWSVLMSDFNNDEQKEIYITNGYRRYALDNDLRMKVYGTRVKFGNNVPLNVKSSLYEEMPSEKLPNVLYQRGQNLHFKNVAQQWGLGDYSFSNGATTGDLDNDGDLDLIVNNIDETAFLYKNLSSDTKSGNFLKVKTVGTTSEPFAKVKIKYNGKSQFVESKRVRGYMSSQETTAHFGLGKETVVDTLIVTWLNGNTEEKYNVKVNTTVELNEKNATRPKTSPSPKGLFSKMSPKDLSVNFDHKENLYDDFEKEILLPYKQSTLGPYLTKGDVNGDGKEDFYVGGASGQAGQLYMQTNNGFRKNSSKTFDADRGYEDMESVFFDIDGDTDLDLFVVSGGNAFAENSSYYADRIYLNDGNGVFSRFACDALMKNPKSGKTVSTLDFDKDGDLDILVGNRIIAKNYPKPNSSQLYENKNGTLINVTSEKAPGLLNYGIVNSSITTDFNNDGWQDIIVVGEWTNIGFFENKKGSFLNISDQNTVLQEKGWWFSIRETDVNNDGLKDYLVGNAGRNLKFKASKKKPFKIFSNDFDGNGSNDIVLSKEYNGRDVPVRGRECSSQQMPFILEKYPKFKDFANASLVDIYGDNLDTSYSSLVTEFNSILLLNKGDGNYEKKVLPVEAQIFPVLDCEFFDVNKDGFEDVIMAGNIYETEVETPRLDAFSGIVLLSNGKDGYKSLTHNQAGIYLEGNVKSLQLLHFNNDLLLINTTNNGPLGMHKFLK